LVENFTTPDTMFAQSPSETMKNNAWKIIEKNYAKIKETTEKIKIANYSSLGPCPKQHNFLENLQEKTQTFFKYWKSFLHCFNRPKNHKWTKKLETNIILYFNVIGKNSRPT